MRTACATLVLALAVAFVAGAAFAADTAKDAKATVMGKIEVKTEKVANKDTKVPYVVIVSEPKAMDGKLLANLKGKTLKVIGAKAAEAEKLAGKEATLVGTIKDTTIEPTLVMEKKLATAAAVKPAPAPALAPKPASAPAPAPASAPAPAPAPAPK